MGEGRIREERNEEGEEGEDGARLGQGWEVVKEKEDGNKRTK